MRKEKLEVIFYKIILCLVLVIGVVLFMSADAYAYNTNVSGVGNSVNSFPSGTNTSVSGVGNSVNTTGGSTNTSVSGTGNSTVYTVANMQEAQNLVKNIRVSGVGNSVTINCYSTEVQQYLINSFNKISVSGVRNVINVVLVPQQSTATEQPQQPTPTEQPQTEVQPTEQPQTEVQPTTEPVEENNTTSEEVVKPTPTVNPTSQGELDEVPKTADETHIKQVGVMLVISMVTLVISGIVIVRRRRSL